MVKDSDRRMDGSDGESGNGDEKWDVEVDDEKNREMGGNSGI